MLLQRLMPREQGSKGFGSHCAWLENCRFKDCLMSVRLAKALALLRDLTLGRGWSEKRVSRHA